MIETPSIERTEALPAAVIRITIPRERMRQVMGPSIEELLKEVASQGLAPSGALFAHHLRTDAATFDFELGVPIDGAVKEAGRVRPGRLPAATVARTVYQGPYDGLPAAWGEFDAWIRERGREKAPDLWERYLIGPESGPDPTAWLTELARPLLD